jgi:hypothetical protein
MDSASYNPIALDMSPTSQRRENETIARLSRQNVHPSATHKGRLLELVRKNKSKHKIYELHTIAQEHRYQVVHLPLYHWQHKHTEVIRSELTVSSKNIGPITDCDITYQLPTF